MLENETREFILNVPPFGKLSEGELEMLAEDIVLDYYPKGVKILTQNGPPSSYLRLIKKGAVKVYRVNDDGEENIIDYRSEAEQFGLVSVISGDRSRANVVTLEDTICYLISKEKIVSLFQSNPAVNEHYMQSFFINFIDKTYDENKRKSFGFGEGDRRLFTTTLGSIVSRKPVTAGQDVSINDAAKVMTENKVSSVILLDEAGVPVGIITDRDLREKVVSKGRDIDDPASLIMSSPLIRMDADEFCFEGLLGMMRYKIHHLLVVEKGQFRGIVTNHDFMVLQGSSPTVLVKEIERAINSVELAAKTPKLHKAVSSLILEGAKAANLLGFITEITEKMLMKSVSFAEQELGSPPIPYSVFFYGASGRRELALPMHLRAGIIIENTSSISLQKVALNYFLNMAEKVNSIMSEVCAGGVDEVIPNGSVKDILEWESLFNSWKLDLRHTPQPEFFDMRRISGPEEPAKSLVDTLFALADPSGNMLGLLAKETLANRPPLGFFRRFVVEKSGEHRNEFDLMEKGIRPLVDSVRVFALERGVHDTSTQKRLRHLGKLPEFTYAEDITHALDYMGSMLIHKQIEQIERGLLPDTFVHPDKLTNIEKNTLREIFKLTETVYDILEKGYLAERGM